jgi:hypothetical protein
VKHACGEGDEIRVGRGNVGLPVGVVSPTHDGAVVIEGDRIASAGSLFPLSQNQTLPRTLGTRHRAAIGLTEESDAVCVVVSEETGAISVSVYGKLTRDLDEEGLRRVLKSLFRPEERGKAFLDYVQQRFRFTTFGKREAASEEEGKMG